MQGKQQVHCKGKELKLVDNGRNLIARHINISPIPSLYIPVLSFLVVFPGTQNTLNLHKASQLFTMTTKILPKNSGSSPSFAAVSSAPRDPNRVTIVKAYHGTPSGCSRFLRYASPMCGFILGPSPVLKVDHFGGSSVKPIFIL